MRSPLVLLLLALLTACRTVTAVSSPTPAAPLDTAAWPRHTIPALALSVAYPPGWNVFDAAKSLQITPNSQPAWSSFADPAQPNYGPTFDLLYNLNRQMGATPPEELQTLLRGYEGPLEVIDPPASPPGRPDLILGTYRFPADGSILLLGAVQGGNGRVVSLVGAVAGAQQDEVQRLFEGVLRSVD